MRCCARPRSWSRPGCSELLVISQDTSAYGARPPARRRRGGAAGRSHITDLARELGLARRLGAAALRLSLPARPRPDPADGRGPGAALPRHPVPARPPRRAAAAWPAPPPAPRTLDEIAALARRSAPTSPCARPSSSAIPARPRPSSSTCSTGSTRRSSTASAASSTRTSRAPASNALPDHVPDEVKQERWERFMAKAQAISAAKLAAKVGTPDRGDRRRGRRRGAPPAAPRGDAPEIDGNLFIDEGFEGLKPGDILTVAGRGGGRLRPLGLAGRIG